MILTDNNTRMITEHEWEVWTPQAIECYKLNSDCCRCSIYPQLEAECFMYLAVNELLEKFGEPDLISQEKYFKNLDDFEIMVMDAIIEKGCRTKEDIINLTGYSDARIQGILCKLYMVANTDGCRYELGKIKFPKFLEYVLNKFGGTKNDNDMAQEVRVDEDVYAEINRNIMVHKKWLRQKRKIPIKIGKNY